MADPRLCVSGAGGGESVLSLDTVFLLSGSKGIKVSALAVRLLDDRWKDKGSVWERTLGAVSLEGIGTGGGMTPICCNCGGGVGVGGTGDGGARDGGVGAGGGGTDKNRVASKTGVAKGLCFLGKPVSRAAVRLYFTSTGICCFGVSGIILIGSRAVSSFFSFFFFFLSRWL